VVAVLSVGVIFYATFVFVETRRRYPMMPLALFRSRNFTGANLLTLFLYAALAGTLFFLPLNLIQVQGYTATAAGGASLPFILIMFLLSRWSGGLIARVGSPGAFGSGAVSFPCWLRCIKLLSWIRGHKFRRHVARIPHGAEGADELRREHDRDDQSGDEALAC